MYGLSAKDRLAKFQNKGNEPSKGPNSTGPKKVGKLNFGGKFSATEKEEQGHNKSSKKEEKKPAAQKEETKAVDPKQKKEDPKKADEQKATTKKVADTKKPEPKGPEKKAPEKKPEPKAPEKKEPEKKPEPKAPAKKVPEKKPEPKTPEKKVLEKKPEPKTPEKKVPEKKPDPKVGGDNKTQKKADDKVAQEKKAEPKKNDKSSKDNHQEEEGMSRRSSSSFLQDAKALLKKKETPSGSLKDAKAGLRKASTDKGKGTFKPAPKQDDKKTEKKETPKKPGDTSVTLTVDTEMEDLSKELEANKELAKGMVSPVVEAAGGKKLPGKLPGKDKTDGTPAKKEPPKNEPKPKVEPAKKPGPIEKKVGAEKKPLSPGVGKIEDKNKDQKPAPPATPSKLSTTAKTTEPNKPVDTKMAQSAKATEAPKSQPGKAAASDGKQPVKPKQEQPAAQPSDKTIKAGDSVSSTSQTAQSAAKPGAPAAKPTPTPQTATKPGQPAAAQAVQPAAKSGAQPTHPGPKPGAQAAPLAQTTLQTAKSGAPVAAQAAQPAGKPGAPAAQSSAQVAQPAVKPVATAAQPAVQQSAKQGAPDSKPSAHATQPATKPGAPAAASTQQAQYASKPAQVQQSGKNQVAHPATKPGEPAVKPTTMAQTAQAPKTAQTDSKVVPAGTQQAKPGAPPTVQPGPTPVQPAVKTGAPAGQPTPPSTTVVPAQAASPGVKPAQPTTAAQTNTPTIAVSPAAAEQKPAPKKDYTESQQLYIPAPDEFYSTLFYFSGMGSVIGDATRSGVYVAKNTSKRGLDAEILEEEDSKRRRSSSRQRELVDSARTQASDLTTDLRKLQELLDQLPTFGDNVDVTQLQEATAITLPAAEGNAGAPEAAEMIPALQLQALRAGDIARMQSPARISTPVRVHSPAGHVQMTVISHRDDASSPIPVKPYTEVPQAQELFLTAQHASVGQITAAENKAAEVITPAMERQAAAEYAAMQQATEGRFNPQVQPVMPVRACPTPPPGSLGPGGRASPRPASPRRQHMMPTNYQGAQAQAKPIQVLPPFNPLGHQICEEKGRRSPVPWAESIAPQYVEPVRNTPPPQPPSSPQVNGEVVDGGLRNPAPSPRATGFRPIQHGGTPTQHTPIQPNVGVFDPERARLYGSHPPVVAGREIGVHTAHLPLSSLDNRPWQERFGSTGVQDYRAPQPFGGASIVDDEGVKPWQRSRARAAEVHTVYQPRPVHAQPSPGGGGYSSMEEDIRSYTPFLTSKKTHANNMQELYHASERSFSPKPYRTGPPSHPQTPQFRPVMGYSDL